MRPFSAVLLAGLAVAPLAAQRPAAPSDDSARGITAATAAGLRFRALGPALTSGRIGDIAIHPSDKSTWYVAAASGNLWKTVNAGTTWTPIFDDQGSYSIGAIAIDPVDPLTVWVGTGENNSQRSVGYGDGVYKSTDGGRTWQNLGLSLLYVGFLPNSFYLISDLIHLRPTGEVSHMFDAVMFTSFIFNGVTAGFASVFLVHWLLIARVARERAHAAVGCILLLCSFAIYLGRELRWNTWDVLINPAGILFDVSERVINPVTHLESFSTTALFFILLGSMYIVVWQFVGSIRTAES